MEAFLRCGPGWPLLPPLLDALAAQHSALFEDLVGLACELQPTAELHARISTEPKLRLRDPSHARSIAAGLQFIVRGLTLQKLQYPVASMGAEVQASHEAAWEACLGSLRAALGSIRHRDAIALLLLKRWKRQVRGDAPTTATSRLADLDWQLGVRLAPPAAPSVRVTLKWTIQDASGAKNVYLQDLPVHEFRALHAQAQAAAAVLAAS
ncbi:hypothetical protein SDRG_14953 [Saprolegnia diclina VS20]|uniref:COMM domain-containing protein n=1 Tax=Saprolegnia diclina (strain VS20) TaxID=1156394 RepID=T0RCA3_SAPDV|nr:hypothetical protein SDRG_14953 [Saprolegnia diclina VS20]EQC27237.1 hypothetical protein SDRG_14953 [Saprolegnia diclina VS20]|eukprot:XP_008619336.1 hypothetical protein SDRG_14953 [Saprolegnia diclina VS20]